MNIQDSLFSVLIPCAEADHWDAFFCCIISWLFHGSLDFRAVFLIGRVIGYWSKLSRGGEPLQCDLLLYRLA